MISFNSCQNIFIIDPSSENLACWLHYNILIEYSVHLFCYLFLNTYKYTIVYLFASLFVPVYCFYPQLLQGQITLFCSIGKRSWQHVCITISLNIFVCPSSLWVQCHIVKTNFQMADAITSTCGPRQGYTWAFP